MQLQLTAMRCCAPDPAAGGSNSSPPDLAGLGKRERRESGREKEKGERKRQVEKKGTGKGSKRKKEGKGEGDKGKAGKRKGKERGKREERKGGGILCSCDFS